MGRDNGLAEYIAVFLFSFPWRNIAKRARIRDNCTILNERNGRTDRRTQRPQTSRVPEALWILCTAGVQWRGVPAVEPIQSWRWGSEALRLLYTAGVGAQIVQHLHCYQLSLTPIYLAEARRG
jgi:hypothetical protein